MNWTDLLVAEINETYHATFGLIDMVDEDQLDWKPASGENWMTAGQLLFHIPRACGFCCKGFVMGEWDMPGGGDAAAASEEEVPAPEAQMPTVESVAQARTMLEADKAVALQMVAEAGEERLANDLMGAPWNPEERPLGQHLLNMVGHLSLHRSQLYYYVKLLGKPVHTGTLWGLTLPE